MSHVRVPPRDTHQMSINTTPRNRHCWQLISQIDSSILAEPEVERRRSQNSSNRGVPRAVAWASDRVLHPVAVRRRAAVGVAREPLSRRRADPGRLAGHPGGCSVGGASFHAQCGSRLIELSWAPSLGLSLSFNLDGLGLLFALLITAIGTLVVLYASQYLEGHPQAGRFYASLFAFMGAMLGVALSDNVLTLFVFWELTGFTSFLLIGFEHERDDARSAALQALIVTGAGGLALLAAGVLLFDVSRHHESVDDGVEPRRRSWRIRSTPRSRR